MVTRYIEANSPTQVNAEKIGVQVVLDGVISIVAGYPIISGNTSLQYKAEETGGFNKGRLLASTDDDIYYYNLETQVIDGVTFYIYKMVGDTSTNYYSVATPPNLPQEAPIYVLEEVEETPTLVQYATFANLFTLGNTTGVFNGPNTIVINNVEYTTFVYPEDGGTQVFLKNSDDVISGWLSATSENSHQEMFEKQETSTVENKTEWKYSDDVVSYTVWTDDAEPEAGDVVYTSVEYPEWNQSVVIAAIPDAPSCTVSYSVVGDLWTDCEDALTDINNVIGNIPRYMYLKFSQDVYITEE